MGVSAAKLLLLLMLLLSSATSRSRAGLADGPASGASLGAAGAAPTGAKCEAGIWDPWGIIRTVEEGWLLLEKRERRENAKCLNWRLKTAPTGAHASRYVH
jgi:hypothetical protein